MEHTKEDRAPMILVVDDEATIRLMTRRFLEHAGFIVLDAASGLAAKKQIERNTPDAVLLDVDMPGMSGFEVCEWIRAQPATAHTPIVMITGREDPDSVDAAYRVGATDFIVKPISWSVLSHRLRYILRGSQTQTDLRESHARVNAIFKALPDMLFSLDRHGLIQEDNTSLTGPADFDIKKDGTGAVRALMNMQLRGEIESLSRIGITELLASGEPIEHEITLCTANINRYFEVRLVRQSEQHALAVVRDVTEKHNAAARIHQLAYYDSLTGLPNRQLFSTALMATMNEAAENDTRFALLYIDLDHFKRINDTLGHTTGDELLKMVARRLEKGVRSEDLVARAHNVTGGERSNVARLGGDEFTLIVRDQQAVENIEKLAERIIDSLKLPFEFNGHEFVVTPSIGIAIYPDDGTDDESLLKSADVAMYQAKQAGRSGYSFCTETVSTRSLERLDLELELRRAIEAKQLELHYQPKIDTVNWRIVGAEALLRWNHAERGWISPIKIIPIAEDTGLIVPIGRWILHEACRQISEWNKSGAGLIPVAVNLSSQQFWQDDIATVVETSLATHDLEANMLSLELTEGVLMRDVRETRQALQTLKEIGVSLAVDDFGTGYSSLAYLRQFPLDELKIDRSFVDDLPAPDAAAICNAIMSMAKSLNLKVVAEGVENIDQLNHLTQHHCDEIQGYYFSKPLPPKEFAELLKNQDSFRQMLATGTG